MYVQILYTKAELQLKNQIYKENKAALDAMPKELERLRKVIPKGEKITPDAWQKKNAGGSDHSYIGSAENCNQSAYQGRVLGCRSRFPTPGNLCHFSPDQ